MKKSWSMAWLVAGCLALGLGIHSEHAQAKGASVEAATKKQKADAKQKLDEGKQAFDERRFELSLERFRESYEIVASPNSHLMVARALAELGRQGQAYDEYQGVIDEATQANDPEKYGKALESAQSERNALRSRLAFLTVKLDATITANGRELPPEQWGKPIAVEPGSAEVVMKSKAGVVLAQRVDVPAGGETSLALTPPSPSAPPPPPNCPVTTGGTMAPAPASGGINQRTLALVSGAVGLVGVGAFAAFGLMNNAQYDNVQAICLNGICPESSAADVERGRTYQTLANVGLGVGIVGLGTGLILWLTSPSGSSSPTTGRTTTTPKLALGTSSVALTGGF